MDSPSVTVWQAEPVGTTGGHESMKINDAALEDFRQRLSEAQHKYDHIKELRDKAEDRLETKDHTYKECYQSISFFI